MTTNPLIPVIDYTSRDYESIRADMIRLIRARIPQWTADNPSDFGVALVEAFAYGTDTLHYYLDRIANEAYLDTAIQRESLYSIAAMFNYTPRAATPAQVDLEFANSTTNEVVVPRLTRVQASVPDSSGLFVRNFETQEEVTLPAGTATAVSKTPGVTATEGRTYVDETLGVSNGYVGQKFVLPRTSVLPSSVTITTQLGIGDSVISWSEVDDLDDADPTDKVFQVVRRTDGSSVVVFGDGLHGDIPGLHAVVRATYRVGGGSGGNVPASSITTVVQPVLYGVTVTNPDAASGGRNAESLDSIRINAARSFRSRDRAVTTADFKAVAESASGVEKAKAVGNNGSSVTVYVAPTDDGTRQPALSAAVDNATTTFLEGRSMAGVTVQVFGAAFTEIFISIQAYCLPTALSAEVEASIRTVLSYEFRYQNVGFDQTVSAQRLYSLLSTVEGLDYAVISGLSVTDPPPDVSTIVMNTVAVNAIPYYDNDTSLTLTMNGGV